MPPEGRRFFPLHNLKSKKHWGSVILDLVKEVPEFRRPGFCPKPRFLCKIFSKCSKTFSRRNFSVIFFFKYKYSSRYVDWRGFFLLTFWILALLGTHFVILWCIILYTAKTDSQTHLMHQSETSFFIIPPPVSPWVHKKLRRTNFL